MCKEPSGAAKLTKGANGNIWSQLDQHLQDTHIPTANKVKAHCNLNDVSEGKIGLEDYICNGSADILAGLAAEANEAENETLQENLAHLLCSRLASIDALAQKHLETNNTQAPEPIIHQAGTVAEAAQDIKRVLNETGHQLVKVRG